MIWTSFNTADKMKKQITNNQTLQMDKMQTSISSLFT